jgi:hypothetical protein
MAALSGESGRELEGLAEKVWKKIVEMNREDFFFALCLGGEKMQENKFENESFVLYPIVSLFAVLGFNKNKNKVNNFYSLS